MESIRSFDILSQRSLEKLESITVYPATEFVLSEEQIRKGIARLEKEAAKQEKNFPGCPSAGGSSQDRHPGQRIEGTAVGVPEQRSIWKDISDIFMKIR